MKTLPLLALVCALAPAASASAPAKGPEVSALTAPAGDKRDPALMFKACPKGTVVVKVTDLGSIQQSAHVGEPTPVPLYCGNRATDGSAVLVATKQPVLTVVKQTIPFSGYHYEYRLNRHIAPTYPLTLTPIAVGDLKPLPQPNPNPHPNPHPHPHPNPHPHPRPQPGPGHVAAIPLTAHEKNWLALDEFILYRTSHASIVNAKPAPKNEHTQLVNLFHAYRVKIENNLPPSNLDDYKAELAKTRPTTKTRIAVFEKELDAHAAGYKYLPDDIMLNAKEQAAAAALPSASGDKTKHLLDDYKAALTQDAQTVTAGEAADKGAPHDDAAIAVLRRNILDFRATTKYRKLLSAGTSPNNPNNPDVWDPSHDLAQYPSVQNNFQKATGLFTDSEWAAYNSAIAAAKTNADKDAVVEQYLAAIVSRTLTDSKKFTSDYIKNTILANLSPWQQQQMCDPVKKAPKAGAGTTGSPLNTENDATQGLSDTVGVKNTLASKIAEQKSMSQGNPNASETKAAPQKSTPPTQTNSPPALTQASPIYLACLNGSNAGNGVVVGGGGGGNMINNPPVPPATKSDTTAAPTDKNVMTHVRNGIAGALAGLILGTLFGPVGVLVGAAVGFGIGYLGDKYLGSGTGN